MPLNKQTDLWDRFSFHETRKKEKKKERINNKIKNERNEDHLISFQTFSYGHFY